MTNYEVHVCLVVKSVNLVVACCVILAGFPTLAISEFQLNFVQSQSVCNVYEQIFAFECRICKQGTRILALEAF